MKMFSFKIHPVGHGLSQTPSLEGIKLYRPVGHLEMGAIIFTYLVEILMQ